MIHSAAHCLPGSGLTQSRPEPQHSSSVLFQEKHSLKERGKNKRVKSLVTTSACYVCVLFCTHVLMQPIIVPSVIYCTAYNVFIAAVVCRGMLTSDLVSCLPHVLSVTVSCYTHMHTLDLAHLDNVTTFVLYVVTVYGSQAISVCVLINHGLSHEPQSSPGNFSSIFLWTSAQQQFCCYLFSKFLSRGRKHTQVTENRSEQGFEPRSVSEDGPSLSDIICRFLQGGLGAQGELFQCRHLASTSRP